MEDSDIVREFMHAVSCEELRRLDFSNPAPYALPVLQLMSCFPHADTLDDALLQLEQSHYPHVPLSLQESLDALRQGVLYGSAVESSHLERIRDAAECSVFFYPKKRTAELLLSFKEHSTTEQTIPFTMITDEAASAQWHYNCTGFLPENNVPHVRQVAIGFIAKYDFWQLNKMTSYTARLAREIAADLTQESYHNALVTITLLHEKGEEAGRKKVMQHSVDDVLDGNIDMRERRLWFYLTAHPMLGEIFADLYVFERMNPVVHAAFLLDCLLRIPPLPADYDFLGNPVFLEAKALLASHPADDVKCLFQRITSRDPQFDVAMTEGAMFFENLKNGAYHEPLCEVIKNARTNQGKTERNTVEPSFSSR